MRLVYGMMQTRTSKFESWTGNDGWMGPNINEGSDLDPKAIRRRIKIV